MTPTLRTIAEACGLDTSTVSRALRGDARVAPATVAQVQAAAVRLGYRPNLAARALRAGATRTMWFVAGSLEAEGERHLAAAATRAVEAAGYDLLIASHRDDAERFDRLLARLDLGLADAGLVMAPTGAMPASPALDALRARRFPLLFLDRSPGRPGHPVVTTDNRAAADALVRRLHADGIRRLAVCGGAANDVAGERRQAALATAAALALPAALDPGADWLAGTAGRLGVFATSQAEIHALCRTHAEALRSQELRFAVFDHWAGEPHPAPLALVAIQDTAALAATAVRRALALIAGEAADAGIERVPVLRIDAVRGAF